MADQFFEELWDEVLLDVKNVFKMDSKFLQTPVFPDRAEAYEILRINYVGYVDCIKKLGECYSQIIQPQERPIIRNLLDSCVGRLLEIKKELVDVGKTDFLYMDDILLRSKKSISNFELVVPPFYRTDRIEKLKDIDLLVTKGLKLKEERIAQTLAEATAHDSQTIEQVDDIVDNIEVPRTEYDEVDDNGFTDANASVGTVMDQVSKRPQFATAAEATEEELAYTAAVLLLQRHERARVARLQTQVLKEKIKLMDDIAWLRHKPIPQDAKLKVFNMVNRYWSRYMQRRRQSYRAVSRNIVMGLLEPSWSSGIEIKEILENLDSERRYSQREAWQAMQDAAVAARIRLEKNSDRISDDIADELRYYIYQWYKYMKDSGYPMLPEWPDPKPVMPTSSVFGIPKGAPQAVVDKMIINVINTLTGKVLEPLGGSALIVAGHWIPVEVYQLIIEMMAKSKGKGSGGGKPKPSKEEMKEKLRKEKEVEAKRLADLNKQGFVPNKSKFIETLEGGISDYNIDWESRDVSRKHNQNMIDLEVAKNLHLELRAQVDDKMRAELVRLQDALNRDRGIRTKKNKGGKKKGKKQGKKKKDKKDPTGDMTEEQLISDLASHDIITSYSQKFIVDLPGVPSIVNHEMRNVFFEDPPPQWGDIKQVVKEYCILSLGSNFVHSRAPLVRSVLICGPQEVIEDYADVICTESGAVRFTLDPLLMPHKEYPKKMFQHLLNKVPRLLKPCVILIPGAEKLFYKKVPKEEKSFNPKALGRDIPKIVKVIKPGDQILVLGISNQPWAAAANKMTKTFDKVICFPQCDYQTLNTFWSEKISKYHGVDRYIDTSTLTTMTAGYGLIELENKLKEVMTPERIISLKLKPLEIGELCMDLEPLETGGKGKGKLKDSWEWSQKNVKMYKQRQAQLIVEAEQRAKRQKTVVNPAAQKATKKKEIAESLTVNNSLLSRGTLRQSETCGPWAPSRQIDSIKEYHKLKPTPQTLVKLDLYRNEKSLPQFLIRRPLI